MRETDDGKIRIVIVDDITETTESLAKLIAFEPDMEVVGRAFDGEEAIRVALAVRPDIVLMDILMPIMDGITATERLTKTAGWTAAVMMMSVQGTQDYLRRAMLAGAREYLVKPFTADELINAIRHVYSLQPSESPAARAIRAEAIRKQRRGSLPDGTPASSDTLQPAAPPPESPASETTVVDLMAALRASVEAAKAKEHEAEPELIRSAPAAPPETPSAGLQSEAPADGPHLGFARASLLVNVSTVVGLVVFVLVMLGVVQAYGAGPGILRGFLGGVVSFFAHLTGGALITWLGWVEFGTWLAIPFSFVGAARGRKQWYIPILFFVAAVAIPFIEQFLTGVLGWLGGVSRWNDASFWGAIAGVTFLMAITAPAFIRDLWRWCNGMSLTDLFLRQPISIAWVMVPFQAFGASGSPCLVYAIGGLVIFAVIGAVCGRGT